MKATIVDLRYKMRDVLAALDRNEEVTIYHRGKPKGILKPFPSALPVMKVVNHPFFGSSTETEPVEDLMKRRRAPRHHAL